MRSESEDTIQAAFFQWLAVHERRYPELALFYSIPNGSHKSIAARVRFKRTGLKSGVPDCHLPVAQSVPPKQDLNWSRQYGLWIEFKSKKGVLSDTQKEWIERLKASGHRVEVCRSWIDAANATIDYLQLPLKAVSA